MTADITPAELAARLEELIAIRKDFVAKRLAMNASRPDPMHATKAERDLYDERYRADHEAERTLWTAAIQFATFAADHEDTLIAALRAGDKNRRELNDSRYMIDALVEMLGPNGLKVWQSWKDRGVCRVHYSWGSDAASMTGEDRAAVILAFDAAPRDQVHDVDAPPAALAPTAPEGEG